MHKLGGSIFVRNAIQYDYCVIEAVQSLIPVCDHVVVMDCQSGDGTKELLKKSFAHNRKVTVASDAYWNCAVDNTRLAILANVAKSLLDCQWHFMLQADEILHERSYETIKRLVKLELKSAYHCRRINFYGNPRQHVRFDIPLNEKPCDDHPVRLGRACLDAMGDGESIDNTVDATEQFTDIIVIHHYGFVRRPLALVDKTVDAFKWFFGGDNIDTRFNRMQDDREYRWTEIMRPDQMTPFTGQHPKVIRPWLNERWEQW